MLENIYWIIAILTMLTILALAIYNIVTTIKNDIDFKKYKKRQIESLNILMDKLEKEREDN